MKKTLIILFCTLSLHTIMAQTPGWIENVTSKTGLDSARGGYVYVCDLNNDFYPEIIMVEANLNKGHVKIYRNTQDPNSATPTDRIFEDITEWSNIDLRRDGTHGRIIDNIVFADIDNDGDPDAITGIYYHRWEYYHPDSLDPGDRCEVMLNNGNGRFTLVENSGLNTLGPHSGKDEGLVNTTGMAFLDYDLDGNLDLFVASWFDDYKNNVMTPSYLLKGNGDGTFTDVSFESWIKSSPMPLYGVNATDWNNDGWMDIATSPYCRSSGSLWQNQKNGKFKDVAFSVGYNTQLYNGEGWGDQNMTVAKALCTWASQPADFDNDGDMDFFFCLVHGGFGNDVFGNTCGRSSVIINRGKQNGFKLQWDIDRLERKAPRSSHLGDYDACWIDLDNDMLPDMVMGNGGYSSNTRLFIAQQQNDTFLHDISKDLGIASPGTLIREIYSVQPIDYDLDGDDDILIAHGDGSHEPKHEILLIENKIGQDNNFISIFPDPPADCNKSAVGCRITVYSGGVAQMREIKAGFGHFSGQQPFLTNFGLGANNTIDSIVVRWQTDPLRYTRVLNPPVNEMIVIKESGLWGTLGVEIEQPERIRIFPNPASEYLYVVSKQARPLKYSIFDQNGRLVMDGIPEPGDARIVTGNLPNGFYYIFFTFANRKPIGQTFIIQK